MTPGVRKFSVSPPSSDFARSTLLAERRVLVGSVSSGPSALRFAGDARLSGVLRGAEGGMSAKEPPKRSAADSSSATSCRRRVSSSSSARRFVWRRHSATFCARRSSAMVGGAMRPAELPQSPSNASRSTAGRIYSSSGDCERSWATKRGRRRTRIYRTGGAAGGGCRIQRRGTPAAVVQQRRPSHCPTDEPTRRTGMATGRCA